MSTKQVVSIARFAIRTLMKISKKKQAAAYVYIYIPPRSSSTRVQCTPTNSHEILLKKFVLRSASRRVTGINSVLTDVPIIQVHYTTSKMNIVRIFNLASLQRAHRAAFN